MTPTQHARIALDEAQAAIERALSTFDVKSQSRKQAKVTRDQFRHEVGDAIAFLERVLEIMTPGSEE